MQGVVLGGSKNLFDVECEDGITRLCSIKGKKLDVGGKYYNPLAPGDCVSIEPDEKTEGQGQIIKLLPRRNEYGRWNVKGREPQLLAANVDLILCITTPDEPPFRPRFVDRVLAQAECAGITPVIVCNKCDLDAADDPDFDFRLTDWENIGYKVLRVSAATGEGLDELAATIEGKLCVLTGQSGVGKSSLINRLDPSLNLKTGELSDKYGRGTHTTTRGNLLHIKLEESFAGKKDAVASIIDTPGVRRFVLNDIAPCDLALYFREMKPLLGKCSFGMSCTHTHEAGCKILEGVYAGAISEERYESWQRICDELSTGSWED
ncbi:MAG: ribosome small subunit-dependent GTPase A [Spirochaetaceae bacterium]|nr:ribosome small subunit-dependent GTPase A [Spirochaetaceae bacterium]MBO4705214.1 ribosome small subunit-dependent GTPase A [Spirochaetaceae bacterium]